jgi:hypothetical protein
MVPMLRPLPRSVVALERSAAIRIHHHNPQSAWASHQALSDLCQGVSARRQVLRQTIREGCIYIVDSHRTEASSINEEKISRFLLVIRIIRCMIDDCGQRVSRSHEQAVKGSRDVAAPGCVSALPSIFMATSHMLLFHMHRRRPLYSKHERYTCVLPMHFRHHQLFKPQPSGMKAHHATPTSY